MRRTAPAFRPSGHIEIDANPSPRIVEHLRSRFPLTPVPTVPELSLHLAGPGSALWQLADIAGKGFGTPYWAYVWGGGLALARHVLDRPETVAGWRVLDLGSGSGLVAIAAAAAGARHVTAADVDPLAMIATRLNAAANGVATAPILRDLLDGPPPETDIILVGDLFYDANLARRVTAFLDRCLAAGIGILIGDPLRAHLPHDRLRLVADYPGPDFGEAVRSGGGRNAVFSFTAAPAVWDDHRRP